MDLVLPRPLRSIWIRHGMGSRLSWEFGQPQGIIGKNQQWVKLLRVGVLDGYQFRRIGVWMCEPPDA